MNLFKQPTPTNNLFKMAQAAARNTTLLAHFIENQCQQKNITWSQLATELQISETQLAKLALCRQPSTHQFKEDVAQTARYTKIDAQTMNQFLQPASKMTFIKKTFWQKRPSLPKIKRNTGDQSMIIKRALAFGVALVAIFFMSAFIFSQPASADATLQVTSGEVVVEQTSLFNQATTTVVSAGETLTVSSNDTIEVPDNAAAMLYLFEGSTVELAENTVLELTELANNGSDQQIYMTLFNGHVINRVTKLLGVNDAYEVRTPSSTASVRGTIFSVEALNENATIVNVTEGVVEVNLGNEVAQVHAGEMITAVTGNPLNVEPSNNPEMLPTATPTQEPTAEPTAEPTEPPTEAPTDTPATEDAEAAEEQNGNRPENTLGNENGNRPETPPGQDKENGNNGNSPDTVPGNPPEDVPGAGNPPTGGGDPPGQGTDPNNTPNDDSNNGNGSGNNGNGDGSNGNNDGTGNDGNNGNGDGSNGNNGGTGNDGNNGNGSGNNGNGDGSNGNNDGTGNDGNNGNGSGNNGNGDGSNGNNGNGNGNGNGKP